MISIALAAVMLMVVSRSLKRRSIKMERMFLQNLRSREIAAEVMGRKRPLYEGRLLDRDIHIADFEVPEDSVWAGRSLRELALGSRYGVHVSSVLRGIQRINIPNGDFVIFPCDRIQAIGSDEQLTAFGSALVKDVRQKDPDIEKREMKLRQVVISEAGAFAGKTMKESRIRDKFNCMVVGIEEGKENLSPVSPARVLMAGDIVWLVGEEDDIMRFNAEN